MLKKQNGIGLLELMLALAIIAMMMVAASKYYQSTQTARRVQVVVESAQAVYSAGERYQLDAGDFTDAEDLNTKFTNMGYLSGSFLSSANPWSSSTTANTIKASGTKKVVFTLAAIPIWACNNIAAKLTGVFSVGTCTAGTATIITIDDT